MKGESLSESLITVLKQSIDQARESNKESNLRMDQLASTMATLAKTVERSEERHISHQDGLERIGTEVKEEKQINLNYRANNDQRVMEMEKQFLLLNKSDTLIQKRFAKLDKFAIGIISSVLGASLIAWMVVK